MTLRVHEVAAELGMSTRQVMNLLREAGAHPKGPSSPVEPQHLAAIRSAWWTVSRPLYDRRRQHAGGKRAPGDKALLAAELLQFKSSGFLSIEEWRRASEVERRARKTVREAAARSRELYEEAARARQEANRRRWEGTYEKPETATASSGRPVVYLAGAPGLGKRR